MAGGLEAPGRSGRRVHLRSRSGRTGRRFGLGSLRLLKLLWTRVRSSSQRRPEQVANHGLTPLPNPPRCATTLFTLGQMLALDKILSGNLNIGCMTCRSGNGHRRREDTFHRRGRVGLGIPLLGSVFPMFRYGGIRSEPTARMADRAVPYDLDDSLPCFAPSTVCWADISLHLSEYLADPFVLAHRSPLGRFAPNGLLIGVECHK